MNTVTFVPVRKNCPSLPGTMKGIVSSLKGVQDVVVNYDDRSLTVTFNPDLVSTEAISQQIGKELGLAMQPQKTNTQGTVAENQALPYDVKYMNDQNQTPAAPSNPGGLVGNSDVVSGAPQTITPPQKAQMPSQFYWVIVFLCFVVVGVGASLYVLSAPSHFVPNDEPKAFIIGGIMPLSGDGASYGIPIQRTAMLAAEEINTAGGINGRKIEFVWKDGQCDTETARNAATDMFSDASHIPQVLIGGACSSEFLASAPIAQAHKVFAISPSATNPEISKLGRYIFRTTPPDTFAGRVAASYALGAMKAKSAAIIAEDDVYPRGLAEVFTKSFEANGGSVVATEFFAADSTDFKTIVGRVKAAKPDVVYILPQTPAPGVVIVKELKTQKVTSKLLTAEVLLIRDAVQEHAEVLEGLVGIELGFDKTAPKAMQVLEKYKRAFGQEPTYPPDAVGTYDLMYLMRDAFESSHGDPEKALEYMYDLNGWEGAIGRLTFDSNGDPALPFQILRVTHGTTEPIDVIGPPY